MAVVALGMFIGWWVRKSAGPSLVSESFSRASPSAPGTPRPGPLTPRDPAVAGFLAEFASLDRPGSTLLRLQADLAAGRITDFETLAKSLLSHPLRHFREEAMRAALAAWSRKDPAGALRFMYDYGCEDFEIELRGGKRPLVDSMVAQWAERDPAAALEFLAHSGGNRDMLITNIVAGTLSKGDVIERLRLLKKNLGESSLAPLLQQSPELIATQPSAQQPSAAEWHSLAEETHNRPLAARFAREALIQKFNEAKASPSLAQAAAWLAEFAPSEMRNQIKWESIPSEMMATLLPALSAKDLQSGRGAWVLASLYRDHSDVVLGFLQQNGPGWVPSEVFGFLGGVLEGRPEHEWNAVMAAATEPAQRAALARGLVANTLAHRGRNDPLDPLIEKVVVLGSEGESAMAALLGGLRGETALRASELFMQLPPEFQAERRMGIVAELASKSPSAAAELWLAASPDELAQPGAATVTESIAERYLNHNSEAASDWIGRLPAGVGRDRAVARMIQMTVSRDPETCAQWAVTIQDPAAMQKATEALDAFARRRQPPFSNQ